MGGGGGGGSSSSSSSTTTTQVDERIAATDNAVVVQLDSGASIQVTDPVAWEQVSGVLEQYNEIVSAAADYASGESEKTNKLVEQVLAQSQSEDRQNIKDVLMWGAVIAIGVVAVQKL